MSYIEPNNNDVLKGRGRTINEHHGNRQFRRFVNEIEREYVQAPKEEKPFYAKRIIAKIASLSPPGRFLKYDDETEAWCEMSKKDAENKTRMVLRDKAPQIRSELEAFRVGTAGDADSPTPTVPRPLPPFSIIRVDGTFRSVATSIASYSPPMQSNDGNIIIPSASFIGTAGTSIGSLPHYPANMRPISAVSNPPSFLASYAAAIQPNINPTAPSLRTTNTRTDSRNTNDTYGHAGRVDGLNPALPADMNAMPSDPYDWQTHDAAAIQPAVNPPAQSLPTTMTQADHRDTYEQAWKGR
jgi:phosphopantetheinyl transferase (holo-ACP synthase)